ncbi:Ubiquitin-conjugating enzyme E2 6 [Yarrowia sp. C11]|nr:Ubiquitin-conjugating enzyme E2 6 [Yarrowia sp. E02]KAG5369480.1 Ubiquitin-conjugating enzyme E2 6 [Yarrowia sp. C11]
MASPAGFKRLTKEYQRIQDEPVPYILTRPTEANILEWYYVIQGPPDTDYEGGQYLGKVVFPSQYPYAPPNIRMLTPNGRFLPDTRLCLSISDYHPESWNPSWGMGTILTGLLSFMTGTEHSTGCDTATNSFGRKKLAQESHAWNQRNPLFQKWFESKEEVEQGMAVGLKKCGGKDEKKDKEVTNTAATSATPSPSVTKHKKPEVVDLDDSPPSTPRVKKKKKPVEGDSEFEPILLD